MIKFEAVIKPFFSSIEIKGTKSMNEETQEIIYNSLDEWNSFKMFDKRFHIHFWYDESPEVYIYDVSYDVEYGKAQEQDVKLIIEI